MTENRKNRYENMMRQNEERMAELTNIRTERFLTKEEHNEYLECFANVMALKRMIASIEEEG